MNKFVRSFNQFNESVDNAGDSVKNMEQVLKNAYKKYVLKRPELSVFKIDKFDDTTLKIHGQITGDPEKEAAFNCYMKKEGNVYIVKGTFSPALSEDIKIDRKLKSPEQFFALIDTILFS
jgi:hypothetical protein